MSVARVVRAAVLAFALLAALVGLVACTSDDEPAAETATDAADDEERSEPSPPAGLRIAVVLPDPTSIDANALAAMAADVARLDSMRGPEIGEIRAYRAAEPEFVADLAWELAERGTDLVCVVGRGSRGLVTELSELYPNLDFCGTPLQASTQTSESLHLLDVRVQELGHVIGLAAKQAADGGRVGVVLGAASTPRTSFRDGLLASFGSVEPVVITVDDELDATTAVERLLAEDVEVVVMDAVAGAPAALELAAESELLVLSPDVVLRGDTAESSVLTWRIRWDLVLRRAIEQLLEADLVGGTSFGFAQDVFTLTDGEAATPAGRGLVARAVEDLTLGELDPLVPVPDPLPDPSPGDLRGQPGPDDADDGADDDDDEAEGGGDGGGGDDDGDP